MATILGPLGSSSIELPLFSFKVPAGFPPGLHHAEAMALSRLTNDCSGVTAFVTLEPCSFHGRTPSCALALINSGVEKIFVGLIDPDPRNSGAGIRMLRDAGITVVVGLLAEEAAGGLADFLVSNSGGASDRNGQ